MAEGAQIDAAAVKRHPEFRSSRILFSMRTRIAVCLFSFSMALAQMPAPAEKPVTLYKGLGIWHHAIRTQSADAQKYFDQGMALNYGFNRYEALRSFRKATE